MRKIVLLIGICLATVAVSFAQKETHDTVNKMQDKKFRRSYYTLAVGAGWSYYFANMDLVPARNVQKNFVGTSFRFMWEPEYRLSLGLETGFYRIYKVDSTLSSEYTMMSRMNVVPLFLVLRMKIVDNFYLSVAPGLALQYSKITGIGDDVTSSQISASNFMVCASYMYPLNRLLLLGGEARVMHFGKTNDYLMFISAVVALKL
jgi:hypothetical protein